MKRTRMKPRAKPIKPVNRKRKQKRSDEAFGSQERRDWMHTFGCVVCHHKPIEIAHVKSRGAGGTADDTVPLCREHHTEQHAVGIVTFQERYDIDLTEKARMYAAWWAEGGYSIGF